MSLRGSWLWAALAAALLALLSACQTQAPPPTSRPPGFELANVADIPDHGVLYVAAFDTYLVDSPLEGYLALWEKSPHLGCRLVDVLEGAWADDPPPTSDATRFWDPCHGAEFDMEGYYLAGASPRSMARFGLALVGDTLYMVDGVPQDVPRPERDESEE